MFIYGFRKKKPKNLVSGAQKNILKKYWSLSKTMGGINGKLGNVSCDQNFKKYRKEKNQKYFLL
jgi:hypothetical protein